MLKTYKKVHYAVVQTLQIYLLDNNIPIDFLAANRYWQGLLDFKKQIGSIYAKLSAIRSKSLRLSEELLNYSKPVHIYSPIYYSVQGLQHQRCFKSVYHKTQQEIFIQMHQQQLGYLKIFVKKVCSYVCVCVCVYTCRWEQRLPVDVSKDDKVLPSRDTLLTGDMGKYHNSSVLRCIFFTL